MIRSFAHKGLLTFFERGSTKGIQAEHAGKLRHILSVLDCAKTPQDMNLPGFRLHPLKGGKKGLWAVTVRANWRVIFEFEDGDVYVVNYVDYH